MLQRMAGMIISLLLHDMEEFTVISSSYSVAMINCDST